MWMFYLLLLVGIGYFIWKAVIYITSTSSIRKEGRELEEEEDRLNMKREVIEKQYKVEGLKKVIKREGEALNEFKQMD